MDPHIIRLLVIMTVCGIGGGIINYLMEYNLSKTEQNESSKEDKTKKYNFSMSLWKCIFTGIGASFLVPLLLKMISSNLLETSSQGIGLDYFTIAGFCLVASISSTRFITTISEKVLKLAKETKEEVEKNKIEFKEEIKQTKEDVEVVQNALSDPSEDLDSNEKQERGLDVETTLNPEDIAILKTFDKSKYVYRSLKNMAIELKLSQLELKQKFDSLCNRKLIGSDTRKDGTRRYYLTFQGRMKIQNTDINF